MISVRRRFSAIGPLSPNHKRILVVVAYVILCILLLTACLPTQPHLHPDTVKFADLTSLYWDQRVTSGPSEKVKDALSHVSLWPPTDQFAGRWGTSYDDRILAQLLWTATVQPTKVKRIALPDGFTWWWHTQQTLSQELQTNCPNLASYCQYVAAGWDSEGIDVVLSKSSGVPKGNYTRAVYKLESSFYTSAHLEGTDLLCSYWRGSDIPTPYAKFVYYDPWVQRKSQSKNYAAGKTKMAAIIISNCYARNGRLDLVSEIQNNGVSVDIYGRCGPLSCPRTNPNSCINDLNRDYKFYLAFENSNCRDYISEKFFSNGLKNDVVPVVMGAHYNDYLAGAPLNSFIHIDAFTSVKQLADYLIFLDRNDDEYNKYLEWKGTGEFIHLNFFCRFCGMIHYADVVPIPERTQALEFNAMQNANKDEHTRPCLLEGRRHWSSPG